MWNSNTKKVFYLTIIIIQSQILLSKGWRDSIQVACIHTNSQQYWRFSGKKTFISRSGIHVNHHFCCNHFWCCYFFNADIASKDTGGCYIVLNQVEMCQLAFNHAFSFDMYIQHQRSLSVKRINHMTKPWFQYYRTFTVPLQNHNRTFTEP